MNKGFIYSDLFQLLPQSEKVSKLDFVEGGKTPAYSSDTSNNGCLGFVDKDASFTVSDGRPVYLIFGDHTRTMNIVHNDFCVMDNVKVLVPKIPMSDEILIYVTTAWKKAIPNLGYARHWSKAQLVFIELPVITNPDLDHEYTVDDIDWQYMHNRITELEHNRITELDAYLQATGLNDYELTEEDKKILSLSAKRASDKEGDLEDAGEDEVRFGELTLGGDDGLFDIYSPKKRFNANAVSFGGKYPYVARGSSNNGIRGYITEDEKYLSPAKSLSFGQDTATVYYQPDAYFTGDKIKVMVLNNKELTPELAEYFIAIIARAFSTFAWGQSSFNENIIKSMKIQLPITPNGTPDFDYMERYIRAIEKVVIADVVKYKDNVIETTKKVVGE